MIKRCGIIFLFLFYGFPSSYAEAYSLEKIVVTRPSKLNKVYIDGGYLEKSAIKSIPEAIGRLGVDTQSRCLNYGVQTDFSLRGMSFEGLTILLDGQRINDPQTGHHNSDIPLTLADIEGIELDIPRNTINIIPKPPGESKNILESSYGEYQTYSSRLSISNKKDNPGVRFSLETKNSDGFREDTDFRILTASLFSSLEFSCEQEAFMLVGYDEKEFGAYDFYTPGQDYPSREWTQTHIVNTGLNLSAGSVLLKPRFLWRRHYDKFMLDETGVKTKYLNHHRTDIYAGSLSVVMPQGAFGRCSLAAECEEEKINSTALGRHSRAHYRVSVDTQKELKDRLILGGSLYLDYFDSFKHETSGLVTLNYALSQHQYVNLDVSSTIRRPSFTELYYEDPTTRGNTALAPEESLTYELGYNYRQAELDVRLAVFFRQEDNLINWIKQTPEQIWQARNMLEADCFGIQARLETRLSPILRAGFNSTYIDKQLKDTGFLYKYGVPYAACLFSSFFEFDFPCFSSVIELEYKKRAKRHGWTLLNLSLSRKIGKNARIFSKISNLFNVEYQDIEGIPSPGRWAELGVRLEW